MSHIRIQMGKTEGWSCNHSAKIKLEEKHITFTLILLKDFHEILL